MYDSLAIQKLNELIALHPEALLLKPESLKTISDYQESVEKFHSETDADKKEKLEKKILKMFALKKIENGWGGYESTGELDNPLLDLIKNKVGDSSILNLKYAKQVCGKLNEISFKWKLLIERTQKCLREEKFKPDLKPIVTLCSEKIRVGYENEEVFFAVIVIINNHSFIRLKISAEKVEERIQRAIRKDIIDVMLRDKQLDFVFHSIRQSITLDLNSYKEARELQEAIHGIRNTPFFTRPNR